MSLPFDEIMFHDDEGCQMVGDYRYYPLVIVHMDGQPTENSIDFLFLTWRGKITQYAHSRGESVAVVVNLSEMKPPTPTVRKQAGEYASKDRTTPGLLSTTIVLTSAILRGVITAISWIAGSDNAPVTNASSLPHAITQSLTSLEKAGLTPPKLDPSQYVMPQPPRPT